MNHLGSSKVARLHPRLANQTPPRAAALSASPTHDAPPPTCALRRCLRPFLHGYLASAWPLCPSTASASTANTTTLTPLPSLVPCPAPLPPLPPRPSLPPPPLPPLKPLEAFTLRGARQVERALYDGEWAAASSPSTASSSLPTVGHQNRVRLLRRRLPAPPRTARRTRRCGTTSIRGRGGEGAGQGHCPSGAPGGSGGSGSSGPTGLTMRVRVCECSEHSLSGHSGVRWGRR